MLELIAQQDNSLGIAIVVVIIFLGAGFLANWKDERAKKKRERFRDKRKEAISIWRGKKK